LQELNAAMNSLSEVIKFLSDYQDRVELDPARLQQLRERAIELSKLKRKYGPTLERVIQRERDLSAKLEESENLGDLIEQKRAERVVMQQEASAAAEVLSAMRRTAGNKLAPPVVRALKELGIEKSQFEVKISRRELVASQREETPVVINDVAYAAGSRGIDDVEYYLSTNVGESPKPLAKVASGGEISRVMLALKTLLAKNDRLPLMVFDEIDVGVSGRIAQKVGRTMKLLAKEHQIIAISHLSQIAAFADVHYLVEKHVVKNSTISQLRKLTENEHIEEVARLISGKDVSEASVKAARSLIKESSVLAI
jgi:DNA repair protein RecN (Recombination protein N)